MINVLSTCAEIKSLLEENYLLSFCEVKDVSEGHKNHYSPSKVSLPEIPSHLKITIQLIEETRLSKVARDRQIYNLLDPYFQKGLHSLEIKFLPLKEVQ